MTQTVESARSDGDLSSIPGKSLGNDNPLQYSCLENPMDGGAWQATACRVAKSQTRLSIFTHSYFKEFESESINYFLKITKKWAMKRLCFSPCKTTRSQMEGSFVAHIQKAN